MCSALSIRVVVASLFSMVVAMIAGCGNSQLAGELDDLVKAVNDGNCEKISSMVDYPEAVNESGDPLSKEEEIQACRAIFENNPDLKDSIANHEVLEERIDGERAYLMIETTTKTPEGERTEIASIVFLKSDGQWRYTNSSPSVIVEESYKALKENDCEKMRDLWNDRLADEKVEQCKKSAGKIVSYRVLEKDMILGAGIVLLARVETEVTVNMNGTEKTNSVNQFLVSPILHDWRLTEID